MRAFAIALLVGFLSLCVACGLVGYVIWSRL